MRIYVFILLQQVVHTKCPSGFTDITKGKSPNTPNGDCIMVLSKKGCFININHARIF